MTDIQMSGAQCEAAAGATGVRSDWRECDALFARLLGLGQRALESQGAGAAPVWVDAGLQARARAAGLRPWVHEFMAFHAADSEGCTPAGRAVRSWCHGSAEMRADLAAMAASHWEFCELLEVAPTRGREGAGQGALTLRRVCDDALIQVDHVFGALTARPGEVGAWRVIATHAGVAAPPPLSVDPAQLPGLMWRLEAEHSSWQVDAPYTRADYMRQRGGLMLLRDVLCAPAPRGSALDFWALSRRVDPLVSPVESGIPVQCWRALSEAYERLEALIPVGLHGRTGALYPLALPLADGGVLVVEQGCRSVLVTLLDSREAHQRWQAQRHALHQSASTGSPGRAAARVCCWRAGAGEIFDADVEFFAQAGFAPVESGVVLAVRLRADWRWEDLDARALGRLSVAMTQGAQQLQARLLAA